MRDANWDPLTLNYDSDIARADKVVGQLTAIDPDLTKLLQHGKLLIYARLERSRHSARLHRRLLQERVGEHEGEERARRRAPVHGARHGPLRRRRGTSTFDMLGALDQWVEKGKAPDQIPASRVKDGVVDRTRPLCPYPQKATYQEAEASTRRRTFHCK